MLSRRVALWVLVTLFLGLSGVSALAGPNDEAVGGRLANRFHVQNLDGTAVTRTSPLDGTTWSAWALRDRGQFDLAIAYQEPFGDWSDPVRIGELDGLDQVMPAMAIDLRGTVYVAFSVVQTREILLVFRPAGADRWSTPVLISKPGEPAKSPSLLVVGDHLIVGYGSGARTELVAIPLWIPPPARPNGVQDGPDVIDPLGVGNGSTGGSPGNWPPTAGSGD